MRAIREKVPSPEGQSFATIQFAVPRFRSPYHYHPEIELTLIQAGRGQRLVGDNLSSFAPGDLVLMGPDLPHSYFHAPGFDDGARGAQAIVIQFKADAMGGVLQAPECGRIRILLEKSKRGLIFGKKAGNEAIGLIPALVRAEGPLRLTLLLQILAILSEDRKASSLVGRGFEPVFNEKQAGRIGRICEWLTGHFQKQITLQEAARRAHLTPTAFSRFFHRATNRTFVRFLNELRISHACRLLLETDRSIAEIAFEAGFENLSNFNRRFQELKKTSPRKFRASLPTRMD